MLRTPDTGAVLLCSVGVTAAAAVILAISLKKQRPKMVFQFLKKIFGGASEDGGGGGKAVTDDPDSGSKSQENGSSKAVVIEEEASQVSRTAEDAEALLTLNKWITLLDCFVGSWSEHLSKVQVMEALQERLLTVDPLTLGGDQCLPLVELKESSNVIDGGRCSKTTTMVATVLEVGDLLLFSSIASEAEASRRKTLELAYDYLLELRDLISTFKKAFYFTGNDQLAIVETLATKNGKMFQRTERVTGLNTFSASITLTNMAYFSEPSAPSKEAAARSVAHQACEYLRKIAQIGSAQLRNIYGSGGSSNQGSSISSKTVAKAPKQIETPSAAAAAAVGVVDVVDGGKRNSSRVVPFTSTFSSATTATVSTSAQASTFKASTSKASTSNRASPSSSALPEVQLTSSLTDPKLIARWALLLENFSSVSCEKKSKWQTRREMEAKGPREATIFVRPFRETIKLEEGVEVGAGVEKNGDKEDEVVLYWGIAEVAGLVKLREPGKDELDGKDNALTAMFRFLKLTIEMLRVFKRRHQTETGKTARGLVKALHGTYPALIEMKVEKKEVVEGEGEGGEGGGNGLPQKWTTRRLFTVTIELLNVATFTATSSDKQAAREAASKALIELMFKMMGGGSGSGGPGPASKVAGNAGKPSLVEVGPAAAAAKKTAVPSSSSSSIPVDLKKKVTEEVKVAEGGGQSTTSAAASPANKVFWNKSFTANADVLKAAKSPATGKQQPKQPTMTFSNGSGGGPAKKQTSKKGQKAYNPRKHQRFLLWQQKQQQLKLKQQQEEQQQQQKNGGGGFSKNTPAPISSSSSTSAKKPDLEPAHLEVENEKEGGYEYDDEDEDEIFGVEDLWIKFLDKVSVSSTSSSSSSLTSPSQPQPLLPLPTTLPTASSSSAATSPSPLLGFSPAPPSAPSSSTSAASEVVTTTTAAAAKSSPKKEEEKGGNNGGASNSSSGTTFAASIAPAYTEAQLREQLPAVVALIARYSDAVDKVPKRGRVFSPENIKEAFPHHLTATFCPPLEGGESLAWSILHWMQADGQELKTSLKTEEIMVKDALLPSKHYLFTITIDCSAAGGCWPPPLEFTFTGVSPAAPGGLYLDQPEPPCREEAARAALSWLSDLANLLGQFTQLYIEKTGHLSAEKSRPLKNPAAFIKELKKTLSNKAFLRMSPISKKVGKSGKNAHVYSCSVFLDRLVTFVGTGERSELAEANAAQKTVDMLLEMLRTNVVVKEEGYE